MIGDGYWAGLPLPLPLPPGLLLQCVSTGTGTWLRVDHCYIGQRQGRIAMVPKVVYGNYFDAKSFNQIT